MRNINIIHYIPWCAISLPNIFKLSECTITAMWKLVRLKSKQRLALRFFFVPKDSEKREFVYDIYLRYKFKTRHTASLNVVIIYAARCCLLQPRMNTLKVHFRGKCKRPLHCILFPRLFHLGAGCEIVVRLESSCLAFNALYERLTYIVNLIRAAQLNSCVMHSYSKIIFNVMSLTWFI